jgi:hypothetical protein
MRLENNNNLPDTITIQVGISSAEKQQDFPPNSDDTVG